MRKIAVFAFLGVFLFFSSFAYAYSMNDHSTGRSGHGMKGECGMKGEREKGSCCPIVGKLLKKSHFILENRVELGLTDEQAKTITDLKLKAEKDSVQQKADMETFKLDLMAKLKEDKIDVAGVDALIDKQSAQMTAAMKSNVAAYAQLKSTLTPDQVTKMKEIWKSKEKEK